MPSSLKWQAAAASVYRRDIVGFTVVFLASGFVLQAAVIPSPTRPMPYNKDVGGFLADFDV